MSEDRTCIDDAALDWAVRAADPGFDGWDALAEWLEAAPANAAAYERITGSVADALGLLALAPANDEAPPLPARTRRWWPAAIAASLALVMGVGLWQRQASAPYAIVTAPGETRTVALADGSGSIAIAGGSRLVLDRKDPRFATLEDGHALFTIHHDEARPFRVAVGGDTLLDVGTVFEVRHDEAGMSVAVAEGAVQLNPDAEDVRVSPGEKLTRTKGAKTYTLETVPAALVGEWREGRMTFVAVPLAQLAADLSDLTGLAYVAAPGAARRPVSGSVALAPLRADPASLGPLLGLSVRREAGAGGDRWVIGGR